VTRETAKLLTRAFPAWLSLTTPENHKDAMTMKTDQNEKYMFLTKLVLGVFGCFLFWPIIKKLMPIIIFGLVLLGLYGAFVLFNYFIEHRRR
jgi:uncharacterized membrane protein